MKIVKDYPPNFNAICERFPFVRPNALRIVFTYGEILYNPGGNHVSADLMAHEETHTEQQEEFGGVEKWWESYLANDTFRLNMEIEAYGRQYKFFTENSSRQERRNFLKQIAKDLSGPIYGNLIPFERAKELIEYAATY